ncbi:MULTISPECIES: DUF2285 domain-containing protein [unclassified Xanthobacter]|uniref:DUF2285 domain-containing protein n=1 Tax=unclassified Xanthobacter TaxID=2623496 RepID=UPI001F3B4277|nr:MULTISPECIES: DUF2285 domain-containing protein [unclassified Xanthobacter]
MRPDRQTLSFLGPSAGDGLYAVVEDDEGAHQVWLPDGDAPTTMAALIPFDAHFLWRVRSATRFKRRMDGKLAGPWPREQRLSPLQLRQAALMLRAWDGTASGASRREVASLLLNRDVESLRALDWKNAPERRRLARLLKVARETIDGGYLGWLTPRSRRR